jgi:hypothetical protein
MACGGRAGRNTCKEQGREVGEKVATTSAVEETVLRDAVCVSPSLAVELPAAAASPLGAAKRATPIDGGVTAVLTCVRACTRKSARAVVLDGCCLCVDGSRAMDLDLGACCLRVALHPDQCVYYRFVLYITSSTIQVRDIHRRGHAAGNARLATSGSPLTMGGACCDAQHTATATRNSDTQHTATPASLRAQSLHDASFGDPRGGTWPWKRLAVVSCHITRVMVVRRPYQTERRESRC